MVLGELFFFWEVKGRQVPEELRCTEGAQPMIQWSEISWVVRALEYVPDDVLLRSVAWTDPAFQLAHSASLVL